MALPEAQQVTARERSVLSWTANRIAPLDGLRAIAVVGVIYAHLWSFVLNNPPLRVGRVDVNRLLSLFGTGVDLFFVISGFCMFLTYSRGQQVLSAGNFTRFVRNRFKRIAPSFYAAVLVSALFVYARDGKLFVLDVLAHLAFIFSLIPGCGKLAPPFWSLATEWHFYLLLPLILSAFAHKRGFATVLGATMLASVLFRFVVARFGVALDGVNLDHFILSRFVEFGWGIVAARLYVGRVQPPRLLSGSHGLFVGWAISLVGRLMMTDGAVTDSRMGPYFSALSLAILSLGYMIVVWNVVSCSSLAERFCGSVPLRWVGRISYGLYLWHWDIGLGFARFLAASFGVGPASPLIYLLAILVILLPLAELSYRLLEAPYFKRRAAGG